MTSFRLPGKTLPVRKKAKLLGTLAPQLRRQIESRARILIELTTNLKGLKK